MPPFICDSCPDSSRKLRLRSTAVKFSIRLKINKEKRKRLSQRNEDEIVKLETVLASPEILEYICSSLNEGFDKVENEFQATAGDASTSEFGDGSLLEKFMHFLFEEDGFEKILKFILALISEFA